MTLLKVSFPITLQLMKATCITSFENFDLLLFGAPLLVVKVKAALLSRVTPSQPYSIYLFEQKVHSVSLSYSFVLAKGGKN